MFADLPPKYFTYERPAGGMPVGAIEDERNLPLEGDEEEKEADQMQVDEVEAKEVEAKEAEARDWKEQANKEPETAL